MNSQLGNTLTLGTVVETGKPLRLSPEGTSNTSLRVRSDRHWQIESSSKI
jgi:hypothetical protein